MELWPLLLILGLTTGGIGVIRRFAPLLHLVDEPNYRSIHKEPIPRGGGVAFVVAALMGILFYAPAFFQAHLMEMLALGAILGIGFFDDRHETTPPMKFFIIALATLILWKGGLSIDRIGSYFGMEIRLGWLAVPFTFFALSGFTNAFNLVDGIDGLAATLALVILGGFVWLGWREGDSYLMIFGGAFLVAVAGFLWFNWYPASIFMGDSGSLTLGFLIGMLAIHALNYLPSVSALYLGAIPILDTLVAMIRRKRKGHSPMRSDRCHCHHLLLKKLGSVPKTVLLLGGVQFGLLLLGMGWKQGADQTLPLLLFFLLLVGAYRCVSYLIRDLGIDCYPSSGRSEG